MIFIRNIKILGSFGHLPGTKFVIEHPTTSLHSHITKCKMFVYYVVITIFASLFAYKKPRLNFRRVKVYVNINVCLILYFLFFGGDFCMLCFYLYKYIYTIYQLFLRILLLSFMSPFLKRLFLSVCLSLSLIVCLDV